MKETFRTANEGRRDGGQVCLNGGVVGTRREGTFAGEVEHVKAHLDEVFMADAKAETRNQEREDVYAALQCAASFLVEQWKDCEELRPKPKEKDSFIDKKSEGIKRRTEWCPEANRYRCMRCGKGSKYMKMPGRCTGPKLLSKGLGEWRQGEVLIWCRKCSGYARQRMGAKLMNCCKPEQMGTKEYGKMFKRIQTLED